MALGTLDGKIAVVTGAARGIGRALVEELVAQGASVCLADLDEVPLDETTREISGRLRPGQRLLAQPTDVAQPDSVETLASVACSRLGDVDLLCANAGVTTAYGGAPDEMPLADWHRQFDVNVFGIVHCLQSFLPRMRARTSPSHVLITGSSAGLLPTANRAAYCASKHAVVRSWRVAVPAVEGHADRRQPSLPGRDGDADARSGPQSARGEARQAVESRPARAGKDAGARGTAGGRCRPQRQVLGAHARRHRSGRDRARGGDRRRGATAGFVSLARRRPDG